MNSNKFGSYIQKLMATIVDKEIDDFVKQLAWNDLKRINSDVEEFLRKHSIDDEGQSTDTVEKMLLLEEDK